MNQPLGDFTLPSWIKNNAGWWAGDDVNVYKLTTAWDVSSASFVG
jgi:hypothetical protein